MESTNEQLKEQLDELTIKFNQLLQELDEAKIKKQIVFSDLEIDIFDNEVEEQEEDDDII